MVTDHDDSNGYEGIADEYMSERSPSIGTRAVQEWAKELPPGTRILDLGCGHGLPLSRALALDGFRMYGVDASPTLLACYRDNVPGCTTEQANVLDAALLGQAFDAVLVWGLLFLLSPSEQGHLFRRVAVALRPGGTFLFTAPAQEATWVDTLTQRASHSLGAERYLELLADVGMRIENTFEDEAGNHYYIARKKRVVS